MSIHIANQNQAAEEASYLAACIMSLYLKNYLLVLIWWQNYVAIVTLLVDDLFIILCPFSVWKVTEKLQMWGLLITNYK